VIFRIIENRLTVLEAMHASGSVSDCDWKRRHARYSAYFDGRPWVCTGNPERKAQRDVKLARYQKYFDNLGVSVADTERL